MKPILRLLFFILLASLGACNQLEVKRALEKQKPKVSIAGKRITHLDFDSLGLAFDIKVDNPNPVNIDLAGLDYELKLAGHAIASGKQQKALHIGATGSSGFELPLDLSIQEILQSASELKAGGTLPYEFTTGLMIDIPLLGKLRYPVTARGKVPIPKKPAITLQDVALERLSLSGASVLLKLEVENPNAFAIDLNRLDYRFSVNGKQWASGRRAKPGALPKDGKGVIALPIDLDFMQLGSGLYNLLSGNEKLDYRIDGKLDAVSSEKLIGQFSLPFDRSGKIELSR